MLFVWLSGTTQYIACDFRCVNGIVAEFDHSAQDWTVYCECMEQYFLANDIQDASKQSAILMSVYKEASYLLLRNLVAQNKPTDKSF